MRDDFDLHLLDDPIANSELYEELFLGKFSTSWMFLRAASCASFRGSAAAVSRLCTTCAREIATKGPVATAEAALLLELNYTYGTSGVLLGAVLTPAFAIESMTRLLAEITLLRQTESDDAYLLAISGFDVLSFEDRVHRLLQLLECPPLPSDLAARLKALIAFRNGSAHDAPHFFSHSGRLLQAKRGKAKNVDVVKPYDGLYPLLSEEALPLTLSHARQAVDTHDDLLAHIMSHVGTRVEQTYEELVSPAYHAIHPIKVIGGDVWSKGEALAAYWERTLVPWFSSVPRAERSDFLVQLQRRANIHAVHDDDDETKNGG